MKSVSKWMMYVVGAVLISSVAYGVVWYVALRNANSFTEEKRVVQNVSLAQAQKGCPIPLPAGATNISYAAWGCGIGFENYVRFEAPPQACLAHVAVILSGARAGSGAGTSGAAAPALARATGSPSPVRSANVDISWLDVQNIRSGFTAGEGGSHQPMIWVDTDRGVFYYRLTD